jgi:hypothetical protein
MQALFAFLALALGATDVYRWVDADGQAHFSDQPQPGAERITITVSPPAQGVAQGAAGGSAVGTQGQGDDTPAPVARYQSLTITSPAREEVLWNIGGELDVVAALQPELQPGHVLRFFLDGRMVAADPGANQARFTEVFRGEHSLRVEVADAAGMTLVSSPTTQFFVRQTSIQNPRRP